jgi:signal peptidase II
MLKYLWLTLLVIIADLSSKAIVSEQFYLYEVLVVIPHWFNLTLAHNSGAAFSF